jgi:hypothetical protein
VTPKYKPDKLGSHHLFELQNYNPKAIKSIATNFQTSGMKLVELYEKLVQLSEQPISPIDLSNSFAKEVKETEDLFATPLFTTLD